MKDLRHSQLYNPLGLIKKHAVYFDTKTLRAYESKLVTQTVQYLETLTYEQLKMQSVRLFKWLVVHQPTNLQHYAMELLDYFHTKGLSTTQQAQYLQGGKAPPTEISCRVHYRR